ncbi:hypothetical protein DFP73DRAFT_529959 [Morchella snyderi]|nr:hypothetical protein DFP73DRAFT_529959 [Morchella snyderi]
MSRRQKNTRYRHYKRKHKKVTQNAPAGEKKDALLDGQKCVESIDSMGKDKNPRNVVPLRREPQVWFPPDPSEQDALLRDGGSSTTITNLDHGRLNNDRNEFFEQENPTQTPRAVASLRRESQAQVWFPPDPSEQDALLHDGGSSTAITNLDHGRLNNNRNNKFFEQDNPTQTPLSGAGGSGVKFRTNRLNIDSRGRGEPTLSCLTRKPERRYRGLDYKIIQTLNFTITRMQKTPRGVHRSGNLSPTPPQPIIVGNGQDAGKFPRMMVDVEVVLSGSGLSNAHKKTIRQIADQRNPEVAIEACLNKVKRDAMEMNRHRFMLGHRDDKDEKSNEEAEYLSGIIGSGGSDDFNMEDDSAPIEQETISAQSISTENEVALRLHGAQRGLNRQIHLTPPAQETYTILHGTRDGGHQRPSRSWLPGVWRAVSSASCRHELRRERLASRKRERRPANPKFFEDRNTRRVRYEKLGL